MSVKRKATKLFRTMKIWTDDHRDLKIIAAVSKMSMAEMLHKLIGSEKKKLKKEKKL